MIGGGFLGGGISIVPAGKALIYASMTTEDGANIPNAVFKATRTGSTVTANGGVDGRAELLVDAGHTYTVTVTPAGGSYLNRSQTVVTASAKSYAVKFYLYPAKANEASTTASLNALNTSISTHAGRTDNPHAVTKAQVGLGSYPASPADIGISTAVQTALDGTVKTTGNQDIGGVKTFTSAPIVQSNDATLFLKSRTDLSYLHFNINNQADPTTRISSYYLNNNYACTEIQTRNNHLQQSTTIRLYLNNNGDSWLSIPMRSSPGTGDAVNKGYLDARLNAITTAMAKAGMTITVEGPSKEEMQMTMQEVDNDGEELN